MGFEGFKVSQLETCSACHAKHVAFERKAAYGARDRWTLEWRCKQCGKSIGTLLMPEEGQVMTFLVDQTPSELRSELRAHERMMEGWRTGDRAPARGRVIAQAAIILLLVLLLCVGMFYFARRCG